MYRGKGVQKHENEFATIGPIKKIGLIDMFILDIDESSD